MIFVSSIKHQHDEVLSLENDNNEIKERDVIEKFRKLQSTDPALCPCCQSFGIRANFRSIQYNRRQPRESQTVKRANQPRMTLPFKYLPHEILNKPKPAPAIRVYPAAPHEFFIPRPTEKPVTPPKPVTTIRARL
nr:hypothetical protein CFP56_75081 [Quercus suber]